MLGCSVAAVYNQAFNLGLKKSQAFFESDENSKRIQRGHQDPRMASTRPRARIVEQGYSGVRVERLQDISRQRSMAEGCPYPNMAHGADPRKWYADLWNALNGTGSWELNPLVWVVEFKVVKP